MQRALCAVGLREEAFLEMVDEDVLHRRCLDWKVKTIPHGHKHKACYVSSGWNGASVGLCEPPAKRNKDHWRNCAADAMIEWGYTYIHVMPDVRMRAPGSLVSL